MYSAGISVSLVRITLVECSYFPWPIRRAFILFNLTCTETFLLKLNEYLARRSCIPYFSNGFPFL